MFASEWAHVRLPNADFLDDDFVLERFHFIGKSAEGDLPSILSLKSATIMRNDKDIHIRIQNIQTQIIHAALSIVRNNVINFEGPPKVRMHRMPHFRNQTPPDFRKTPCNSHPTHPYPGKNWDP
jgi:hypothetical protein